MTDRQASRSAAAALLAGAMHELEIFSREDGARVNPNRWKPLASRDSLQLFRERASSSSSAGSLRNLLCVGRLRGRVEHALFATACESLEQLALLHGFLFGDDVANSVVVATLEPPPAYGARDDTKPNGDDWLLDACSLSVKSVSRRGADASASAKFLEYHGHTRHGKTGELIGFYILYGLSDRADGASVRCLFQQLNNDVIDVFLVATAEVGSSSSSLRSSSTSRSSRRSSSVPLTLASLVSTDTLFNVANLIECAESKRLTMMMRANRKKQGERKRETNNPLEVVAVLEAGASEKRKNECAICRRKKKLFHGFVSCDVCAEVVCTRCRLLKRCFVPRYDASGGGYFEKISACKPCAVIAGNGGKRRPTAVPVGETEAGQPATQVAAVPTSNHRMGRARGRSVRFPVKTTLYSPVSKDSIRSKESLRTRTDSTGSTSSMPTPMARSTPKGGIRLLPSYEPRARKQSSASEFGRNSNSFTPRGAAMQVDWSSQNQPQQQNQTERFPRFTSTLQVASGYPADPYGETEQTTSRYSASARQGYATASAPTTPLGSEQPWSTAAPSPSNLMARMIELNKMAEISYDTTRRNGAFMMQHVRPVNTSS